MKFRALVIPLISLLASCSKSSDDGNVVPVPQQILLKKFVLLNPTLSAPNDTLIVSVYAYDGLNRCTSITSTDYNGSETTITQNFYNGTDVNIQNRKITYEGGDFDHEYYTYNSAGQIIEDSLTSNAGNTLLYKYTVSGSNFNLLLTDFTNNIPVLKAKFEQVKTSNNITAEKDSAFDYNLSGTYFFNNEALLAISYDDHPNPFYNLYPKRLIDLEYENAALDDFYQYYSIPQSNNVLEEQRSVNPSTTGLQTYHNKYTYQYNVNGYPVVMNNTDIETGDVTKGIYIY